MNENLELNSGGQRAGYIRALNRTGTQSCSAQRRGPRAGSPRGVVAASETPVD